MTSTFSPRVIAFLVTTAVIAVGCTTPDSSTPATDTTRAAGTPSVTSSTTTPSGPQAAMLGTALDVTTAGATASYVVSNLAPVPIDAQIIAAQGTMYAVDVAIVAESGTTVFNGSYFAARSQDGASIAPAVGAVKPAITSGQLAPGQTVVGPLAFDVPNGTSITQVVLRDPQGTTLAIWGAG